MPDLAPSLRLTVLWGEDHPELGEVAVTSLGERCALALSRGRHPKAYPHLDPNEDAVAAATDGTATLLLVADGHSGFDAARAATGAVLDRVPDLLARSDPEETLREAFAAAREAVAGTLADLAEPRRSTRTTLTVAVLRDRRLVTATRGDSAAVRIAGGRPTPLGRRTEFLGPDTDLDRLHPEEADLEEGDLLVLATDGLYDFLGRRWPERLAELATEHPDPGAYVQAAVRAAFSGGAGDNVGVGALRG